MNRKKTDNPTAHHLRCALVSSFQWYLISVRESHAKAARQTRMNHVNDLIVGV